jgi:photosystem II stability/assembly factor-like uncharacterized protein
MRISNLRRLTLTLLAGCASLVAISDASAQWKPAGKFEGQVSALASNAAFIFAGGVVVDKTTNKSYATVFRSANKGLSWEMMNLQTQNLRALAASATSVFAGSADDGIFRSIDNGKTWTKINQGLVDLSVWSLAMSGQNILAGTVGHGVFISKDGGQSWAATNLKNERVDSLAANGATVLAGTEGGGVWISTDSGLTWKDITKGIPDDFILAVGFKGTTILAAALEKGIYLSTDNGQVWTHVDETPGLRVFAAVSGSIFAGGNGGGPLSSQTAGKSWVVNKTGIAPNVHVWAMTGQGTDVFAGGDDGGVYRMADVSPVTLPMGPADKSKSVGQKSVPDGIPAAPIDIPGCTLVVGRPGVYRCTSRAGLAACGNSVREGRVKACLKPGSQ